MPSERRTLHAIGNAHIDPVWLWRWPEGLETIRSTFRSALDRMNEFPDFCFTCSSSAFYRMLEEVEPEMLAEIGDRVREGRWELVGGWWVEPDANIPSGESLMRQGLYGQRYLAERFGRRATIGYNPDTFGHPGALPQILRHLGLSRYVFMRPGPHEKDIPDPIFVWRSPDGSEVIAARIARSYCTWPEELAEHVRECARAASRVVSDYVVFYGVGNHGGGPTQRNIESIMRGDGAEPPFSVSLSRLDRFFESVEIETASGRDLPVVAEELQYHARGCYSAHSEIKANNRRAEHLLLAAERAASMARALVGCPYPSGRLTEAWKTLLFTQFHDILAGTSLPEAYRDARDAVGHACHTASSVLYTAAHSIAANVDTTGSGNAAILLNTLPWDVRVPVEVERGSAHIADAAGRPIYAQAVEPTTVAGQRRSCFVADIPALGYTVIRESEAAADGSHSGRTLVVSPQEISNDWWRLRISHSTGCIGELHDRVLGVSVLRDPGMSLLVIDDPSDTWSHGVASFRDELGCFQCNGIVVEEDGSVRASIRSTSVWGAGRCVHRVRLYRDLPIIEGELTIHWAERRRMLKLAMPVSFFEGIATYETPYGQTVRTADGSEQPGQQWGDLTGWIEGDGRRIQYGLAIMNDCKYGYDATENELRLTLLRSPVYAHHDPAQLSATSEYAYVDQGVQTVRYRLFPHHGGLDGQEIVRRAVELNMPPVWVNEHAHSGRLPVTLSVLRIEPGNVVTLVCKQAEDSNDIIVRAYETESRPTRAKLALPMLGFAWEADFAPLQIRTWRVTIGSPCSVAETNGLEYDLPE